MNQHFPVSNIPVMNRWLKAIAGCGEERQEHRWQENGISFPEFSCHQFSCLTSPSVASSAQYTSTSTAVCSASFTTSSNFLAAVCDSLSLAETSGTDSRKLRR